ncbi:MAG: TetR/AcrR family transcriptional regulator [Lachnospiraceae bacterium]|nr:TetR/AcrR family transcriptional regulator [Lachnospiraceae bacterium]
MEIDWTNYDSHPDRRQRKSCIAIEKALLELMQTKPIDMISISELAEKADVNRKTFYNNYNSIEDVEQSIDRKITAFIFDTLPKKITINNEIEIYHLLLNFTLSIKPYKELLGKMAKNKGSITITEHLKDQILPYVEKSLENYNIAKAVIPYINTYIVDSLSSIYFQWFNDNNLNAQQVALLAYNLTTSAIKLDNYRDIVCES